MGTDNTLEPRPFFATMRRELDTVTLPGNGNPFHFDTLKDSAIGSAISYDGTNHAWDLSAGYLYELRACVWLENGTAADLTYAWAVEGGSIITDSCEGFAIAMSSSSDVTHVYAVAYLSVTGSATSVVVRQTAVTSTPDAGATANSNSIIRGWALDP